MTSKLLKHFKLVLIMLYKEALRNFQKKQLHKKSVTFSDNTSVIQDLEQRVLSKEHFSFW